MSSPSSICECSALDRTGQDGHDITVSYPEGGPIVLEVGQSKGAQETVFQIKKHGHEEYGEKACVKPTGINEQGNTVLKTPKGKHMSGDV